MGINLKDIIIKEQISLKELNGKIIGIDAYNSLYQFLTQIKQYDGSYFTDKNGNITSHLIGLFYRNINLLEKGIKLVYIFDGKPPEFKLKTLERRKKEKMKYKLKYEKALEKEDYENAKKFSQRTVKIDDKIIEESIELLDAMGIPIVKAKSEAEAQASYMCNKGDIFAVGSQDYDTLLFGAKKTVRNFNLKEDIEIIYLDKVLKYLGINQDQLIILGMLIGTDFNEGIKGIGPKTALKIVKEKSINEIIKEYNLDEEVFEFFKNPPVNKEYNLKWKEIDKEKLIDLLVNKYGFSENRVISHLEKLIEKNKQKTIFDF